jgi:WhiB family redox-sensing transcriptional regulator
MNNWMQDAACAGYEDPEAFFPTSTNERQQMRETITARSICATCPVSDPCLTHAIKTRDFYSVSGGTIPLQRTKGKLRGNKGTKGQTAQEALFLFEGGRSPEDIAKALDVNLASVERNMMRNNIKCPWPMQTHKVKAAM